MRAVDLKNLNDLIIANWELQLPTSLSIKLARLKTKTSEHIEVYKEVLNKLINECVEKDENGNPKIDAEGNLTLLPDKATLWQKGVTELELEDFLIDINFTEEELNQLTLSPSQANTMLLLVK